MGEKRDKRFCEYRLFQIEARPGNERIRMYDFCSKDNNLHLCRGDFMLCRIYDGIYSMKKPNRYISR